MTIFSGTRLAFLTGESYTKKTPLYEFGDDIPNQSSPTPAATASPEAPTKGAGKLLLTAWVLGGALTVIIPAFARNTRLNRFQNNLWGQGAQAFNQYQEQEGGKQFIDVNNCHWYNFNCEPMWVDEKGNYVSEYEYEQEMQRQYYENQEDQYQQQQEYQQYQQEQQQQQYQQQQQDYQQQMNQQYGNGNQYNNMNGNNQQQPNWYQYWGSNQNNNQGAEWGEPTKPLRFAYIWQLILLAGIISYGTYVLVTDASTNFLCGILLIWFQYNFIVMAVLSDSSITTEDEVMDKAGFYGQYSVLLFMTNAWCAVYGLAFLIVLMVRANLAPVLDAPIAEQETIDYSAPTTGKLESESDYVKVI